jgi:hypothetical protein
LQPSVKHTYRIRPALTAASELRNDEFTFILNTLQFRCCGRSQVGEPPLRDEGDYVHQVRAGLRQGSGNFSKMVSIDFRDENLFTLTAIPENAAFLIPSSCYLQILGVRLKFKIYRKTIFYLLV